MDAIEQINQRISDLKAAIKFKSAEARKLQEELSSERVSDGQKDERKIRELETKIAQIKKEVMERLPDDLKSTEEQLKLAEKAAEEAKEILPRQEKLIPEIKKVSKELLEALEAAQKVNQKLIMLNDRFRVMENKTKSGLERDKCGEGFMSILVLIQVLRDELEGLGRSLMTFPANFRI